jgi:predicted Zn-dependent protease
MEPLQHPDTIHLRAALGWLELGSAREARAELERIRPEHQRHPGVLEVRWQIEAKGKEWEHSVETARILIEVAPERSSGWVDLAYALHEMQQTAQALEQLASVAGRFHDEPIIPYNLACYCCQLDRSQEGMTWLQQAMRVGEKKQIQAMALGDEDLKPLWPVIAKQ